MSDIYQWFMLLSQEGQALLIIFPVLVLLLPELIWPKSPPSGIGVIVRKGSYVRKPLIKEHQDEGPESVGRNNVIPFAKKS